MILSNDYTGVPKRFIGTQVGNDWLLDHLDDSVYITNTVTIAPAPVSGVFTGTFTGAGTYFVGTGNVMSGILSVAGFPSIDMSSPCVAAGTIAGHTGTYTGVITGSVILGSWYGSGAVNTVAIPPLVNILNSNSSAFSLFNDFHKLNTIDYNQWLIFKDKIIKFGLQDFLQVYLNNVFITADGQYGKFDKLVWEIQKDEATGVDYRIKKQWTNNYLTTVSTDNG
jgi:hypothetical protein